MYKLTHKLKELGWRLRCLAFIHLPDSDSNVRAQDMVRVLSGCVVRELWHLRLNTIWESFIEDLEAMSSPNYLKRIAQSRADKVRYSSAKVKKMLEIS